MHEMNVEKKIHKNAQTFNNNNPMSNGILMGSRQWGELGNKNILANIFDMGSYHL